MAALSNEELLSLSTLAYLEPPSQLDGRVPPATAGDVARYYQQNLGDIEGHAGMTVSEWNAELTLITSNNNLASLQMVDHTPPSTNASSGLFAYCFAALGDDTAFVAYRGSEGDDIDWGDNFRGESAGAEGTTQQRAALDYVESLKFGNVVVTGHSKGGNNAQFVAVKSARVTRCVSFDGQGFSREFLEGNRTAIEAAANKITSISADTDFVNVLLHPIAGTLVFLECGEFDKYAHAPNRLRSRRGTPNPSLAPEGEQYAHVRLLGVTVNALADILPNDVSPYIVEFILDVAFRGPEVLRERFARQPLIVLAAAAVAVLVVAVGAGMWLREFVARQVVNICEWAFEAARRMAATAVGAMAVWLTQLLAIEHQVMRTVESFLARLRRIFSGEGRGAGWGAGALNVSTDTLRNLAWRLQRVQGRLSNADRSLDRLLMAIEPENKAAVIGIDWSVGYDQRLARCISYLLAAADHLDACENAVVGRAARFESA